MPAKKPATTQKKFAMTVTSLKEMPPELISEILDDIIERWSGQHLADSGRGYPVDVTISDLAPEQTSQGACTSLENAIRKTQSRQLRASADGNSNLAFEEGVEAGLKKALRVMRRIV